MTPEVAMLLEVNGDSGTARFALRSATNRIGRTGDNDIVLSNEPAVSRQHIELFRATSGTGWRVRDLGSHNGTFVNGERVAADDVVEVTPADVIGVGTVTMRLIADIEDPALTVEDTRAAEMHRLVTALSDREREVLALVAAGHTDDQVATALFISVKTVHSHLDRIRSKTGVRRRAELTRLAVRLGLSGS